MAYRSSRSWVLLLFLSFLTSINLAATLPPAYFPLAPWVSQGLYTDCCPSLGHFFPKIFAWLTLMSPSDLCFSSVFQKVYLTSLFYLNFHSPTYDLYLALFSPQHLSPSNKLYKFYVDCVYCFFFLPQTYTNVTSMRAGLCFVY